MEMLTRKSRGATTLWLLGAATALALLAGIVVHRHALIAAIGFATTLALAIVWPWLAVRAVSVRVVATARRTRSGESLTLRVFVRNRLPLPVYGLLLDLGDVGGSVAIDRVGPLAGENGRLVQPCSTRRGVVRLRDATITCGFPFSLIRAIRSIGADGEIIVWPAKVAAATVVPTALSLREGPRSTRSRDEGCDVAGVRPYRRGDPMRRIHWQATARHDRLMARERHAHDTPSVWIAVDLSYGEGDAGERVLERAAAAVERCAELHFAVGLILATTEIDPQPGASHRDRLLDALARIELSSPRLRQAISPSSIRRASLVFRADQSEAMLPSSADVGEVNVVLSGSEA